jgi:hypothetical protein
VNPFSYEQGYESVYLRYHVLSELKPRHKSIYRGNYTCFSRLININSKLISRVIELCQFCREIKRDY